VRHLPIATGLPVPLLDVAYARSQFPAFAEPSLQGQAFFENAGGSYACVQVIERLAEYYRRLKLQPYYNYPASQEAGEWMDTSHTRLAEYLNVGADELHFGPSTSQNSYVLAQALRKLLKAGDEIIVTNQDHEANSGVWRRLAGDGFTVKEWQVDPHSAALDPAALDRLLSERTRLVTVPQCSNIVAQINPVAEIARKVHAAGAVLVVDSVAYAPHGLPDVTALGADVLLFSLYKTFGPHQGAMVVRKHLFERLGNEAHYFNAAYARKRLIPAGPDHAQVAAARGVAEYFDALDAHHGGGAAAERPQRVRSLLREAEKPLLQKLLDYLAARKDLRLLGSADANQRAATVSVSPLRREPAELIPALAKHGIMAAAGHFYAVRLLEAMGLDPQRGALRLSFVHYTSAEEIERLIRSLDLVLGGH
jgi:cysteine desulfurase family protein (TIGR01976 family)